MTLQDANDPVAPAIKPRGARGMGSVFRTTNNGDNVWCASRSLTLPDPVTGVKKRIKVRAYGPTRSIAVERLQVRLGERENGVKPSKQQQATVEVQTMTFEQWFYTWHSELGVDGPTDIVRHKYLRLGEMYLLPYIGHREVVDLDSEDMRILFRTTLPGLGTLSEASIRNIYRVCQMCLLSATKTRRIPITKSPLSEVKQPERNGQKESMGAFIGKSKGLIRWLDQQQHPQYALWLFSYLGLRRGERLSLRWSDVSNLGRKDAKITVQSTLTRHQDGTGWYIRPWPKANSHREIPLVEPFHSALREWQKVQAKQRAALEAAGETWGGETGEFADTIFGVQPDTGRLRTPNRDNDEWHALWAQYDKGGPAYRGHLARHAAASLLYEAGVNLRTAQSILGHRSEAVHRAYTHENADQKREPMQDFAAVLTKRMGSK